jgi:hypothetical protein
MLYYMFDDLKEKRRYWKLKEEALDRTLWRTRFGRGYGPTERMNYIFDPQLSVWRLVVPHREHRRNHGSRGVTHSVTPST